MLELFLKVRTDAPRFTLDPDHLTHDYINQIKEVLDTLGILKVRFTPECAIGRRPDYFMVIIRKEMKAYILDITEFDFILAKNLLPDLNVPKKIRRINTLTFSEAKDPLVPVATETIDTSDFIVVNQNETPIPLPPNLDAKSVHSDDIRPEKVKREVIYQEKPRNKDGKPKPHIRLYLRDQTGQDRNIHNSDDSHGEQHSYNRDAHRFPRREGHSSAERRPYNRDAPRSPRREGHSSAERRPYNRDTPRSPRRESSSSGDRRPYNRDTPRSPRRESSSSGDRRPYNRDAPRSPRREGSSSSERRPYNRDAPRSPRREGSSSSERRPYNRNAPRSPQREGLVSGERRSYDREAPRSPRREGSSSSERRPYNRDAPRSPRREDSFSGDRRPFNRDTSKPPRREGSFSGEHRPYNRDAPRSSRREGSSRGEQRSYNRDAPRTPRREGSSRGEHRPYNRDAPRKNSLHLPNALQNNSRAKPPAKLGSRPYRPARSEDKPSST